MVLYLCIFTSGPLVSLFAVIRAGCCVVSSEEPLNGTEDCTHGDWSRWLRKILTFIVQRRNRWLQFAVGFILWSFVVILLKRKQWRQLLNEGWNLLLRRGWFVFYSWWQFITDHLYDVWCALARVSQFSAVSDCRCWLSIFRWRFERQTWLWWDISPIRIQLSKPRAVCM